MQKRSVTWYDWHVAGIFAQAQGVRLGGKQALVDKRQKTHARE
jgi:hypothetical protein